MAPIILNIFTYLFMLRIHRQLFQISKPYHQETTTSIFFFNEKHTIQNGLNDLPGRLVNGRVKITLPFFLLLLLCPPHHLFFQDDKTK
jgi:hypothetical protein